MKGPIKIKLRSKGVELYVEGGDRTLQPIHAPRTGGRAIRTKEWFENEIFGIPELSETVVNITIVPQSFTEEEVFSEPHLHPAPFWIPPYSPFTNLCGNPIYLVDFIPSINDTLIEPMRTFHWTQIGGEPVVIFNEYDLFGARFNRDIVNDDKVFELIVDEGTSYETRWTAYAYFTPTSVVSNHPQDASAVSAGSVNFYNPLTSQQALPGAGIYKMPNGSLEAQPLFYGADPLLIGRVELLKDVNGIQTVIKTLTGLNVELTDTVEISRHVTFYDINESDDTRFVLKFYSRAFNNNYIDATPFLITNVLTLPKATGTSIAADFFSDDVGSGTVEEDINITKVISLELQDISSFVPVDLESNVLIFSEDVNILSGISNSTDDVSSVFVSEIIQLSSRNTLDILIVGGIAIGG